MVLFDERMADASLSVQVLSQWATLSALCLALAGILVELGALFAEQSIAWQNGSVARTSLTVKSLASWALFYRTEELALTSFLQKTVAVVAGLVTNGVALTRGLIEGVVLRALQNTLGGTFALI